MADFIGESNFLHGTLQSVSGSSGVALIEGQSVPVEGVNGRATGDEVTLVLRPESAHVGEVGVMPCEVTLSRFMGHYQDYQLRCGKHLVKVTEFNPKNRRSYEVGEQAFLSFAPDDVHVL